MMKRMSCWWRVKVLPEWGKLFSDVWHKALCILSLIIVACPPIQADPITLVTHEYKPYSWMDENREIKGLTVEIANVLFEHAGLEKSWRIMPLKRAYSFVQTNSNSCIFPLQRNQEREADFHWVSPIIVSQFAFYTPQDSDLKLRTLADLTNLKVVTYLGSGLKDYLGGFNIRTVEAFKDDVAANMVSMGRMDVWATDVFSQPYTAGLVGQKFEQKFIFFTSIGALACNRSMPKARIDRLQQELSRLYKTLEIAKIVRRYQR